MTSRHSSIGRVLAFLLVAFLAAFCSAQSVKDQLAALETEAAPLIAKRAENKATLAVLNKTKDDIDFGVTAFTKYAEKYKNDKAAYDIDLGAYAPAADSLNAALNAHNAVQCKEYNHDGSCSAYQAEANQLNARRDYLQGVKNGLDSRKSFLDTTLGQLRELQQTLSDKTDKYAADAKAYNAQNADNEAKLKVLTDKWQALITSLGDCVKEAGPNATDEKLHDVCGERWDGNILHAVPRNQGTGGVTPNN